MIERRSFSILFEIKKTERDLLRVKWKLADIKKKIKQLYKGKI